MIAIVRSQTRRWQHGSQISYADRGFPANQVSSYDNIALAPALDELIDAKIKKNVMYGGPIPTENKIEIDDRHKIIEHQRNFLYPFLSVTLNKSNNKELQFGVNEAIRMSSKNLERDCTAAMDNIEISLERSYEELIPAQKHSVLRVLSTIKYLKSLEGKTEKDMEEQRDFLSKKLKKMNDIRDEFVEHSEKIDSIAEILKESLPELNDEEMLDEFNLKELRDTGNAPWLKR